MKAGTLEIKLAYERAVTIWKNFCELHTKLYEFTCDEYSILLASDLDALDPLLLKKQEIIELIQEQENKRRELIEELGREHPQINSVSELIGFFKAFELENQLQVLHNFNLLLIEIIGKIQEQNKKNQIFLNKAIISLREIRTSFQGKKNYSTYNASGASTRNVF